MANDVRQQIQEIQALNPRDLRERLRAWQRLLDDLDAAITVVTSVSDLPGHEADLRRVLAGLEADLAAAREQHRAELAGMAAELTARRTAATEEQERLRQETVRLIEAKARAEDETRQAEARRDTMQAELAAVRAKFN